MTIRRAVQSDYEQLIELYNQFVGEDRYFRRDNDSFAAVLEDPKCHLFVAEDNGRLLGFASVSIRTVFRYPRPIAELDELYVNPEHRSHGLGLELMQEVENTARNVGCYRLFIESAYAHTVAHAFYEKLGYKNNGYHFMKDL